MALNETDEPHARGKQQAPLRQTEERYLPRAPRSLGLYALFYDKRYQNAHVWQSLGMDRSAFRRSVRGERPMTESQEAKLLSLIEERISEMTAFLMHAKRNPMRRPQHLKGAAAKSKERFGKGESSLSAPL